MKLILNKITKLANAFESKYGPISSDDIPVSKPPVSIERHKDIMGSIKNDITKTVPAESFTVLEEAQKHLSHVLTKSLTRHGYDISEQDIFNHIMKFGEYSDAEKEFLSNFNELFMKYSDKTVHYIINNLSW